MNAYYLLSERGRLPCLAEAYLISFVTQAQQLAFAMAALLSVFKPSTRNGSGHCLIRRQRPTLLNR